MLCSFEVLRNFTNTHPVMCTFHLACFKSGCQLMRVRPLQGWAVIIKDHTKPNNATHGHTWQFKTIIYRKREQFAPKVPLWISCFSKILLKQFLLPLHIFVTFAYFLFHELFFVLSWTFFVSFRMFNANNKAYFRTFERCSRSKL